MEDVAEEELVDRRDLEDPEAEAHKAALAEEVEIVHQQLHHKENLVVVMEILLEV